MSGTITLDYDQADKSLRVISDEIKELETGLTHLQGVFQSAAEQSNITFLKALSDKYDATKHIFRRLNELVDEVRQGLSRYKREYTEYEQA